MHEATCPRCGQKFATSEIELRGSPYRVFNVPKSCDAFRIPETRRPVGLRDASSTVMLVEKRSSLDPKAECAVSAAQRVLDQTLHK